jgi:hypothetical protein
MIDCCLSLSDNSIFGPARHLGVSLEELPHAIIIVGTHAVLLVRHLCYQEFVGMPMATICMTCGAEKCLSI